MPRGICLLNTNTNNFIGLFNFSALPDLLLYSYIPVIFLFLLLYLFLDSKYHFIFKMILLSFCASIILDILSWILLSNATIYYLWFLFIPWNIVLTFLLFKFSNDLIGRTKHMKYVLLVVVVLLILSFTKFNTVGYDYTNCAGIFGQLWQVLYVIRFLLFCYIVFIALINRAQSKCFTILSTLSFSEFLELSTDIISDISGK